MALVLTEPYRNYDVSLNNKIAHIILTFQPGKIFNSIANRVQRQRGEMQKRVGPTKCYTHFARATPKNSFFDFYTDLSLCCKDEF